MEDKQKIYTDFIKTIALGNIQPVRIEFERNGDIPAEAKEMQISWNMKLKKDDPVITDKTRLLFSPLYEILVKYQDLPVYTHRTIFKVSFSIADEGKFTELWADKELQLVFKNQQLVKTLWPIIRQQVLDGMSRMVLPPVTLPFIL
jgi:hypothetical protein